MQILHVGIPLTLGESVVKQLFTVVCTVLVKFNLLQCHGNSKQPPASIKYFTVWERQVRRDTHHVIHRTNTNSPPTLRRWGEVGEVESASAKSSRGFDFAQSVCGACASVTRHFSPFKSHLTYYRRRLTSNPPREQTRRNWAWSVFKKGEFAFGEKDAQEIQIRFASPLLMGILRSDCVGKHPVCFA